MAKSAIHLPPKKRYEPRATPTIPCTGMNLHQAMGGRVLVLAKKSSEFPKTWDATNTTP